MRAGATVTVEQYFAGHRDHPAVTDELVRNARELLARVNALLAEAGESLKVRTNPSTGSRVSGHGNGGWRPPDSTVGAPKSAHRRAQAVDVYDPYRELAQWIVDHPDALERHDLYAEDFRWTPTWVHLQCVPPGSGRRVFVPSSAPPLAPALRRSAQ